MIFFECLSQFCHQFLYIALHHFLGLLESVIDSFRRISHIMYHHVHEFFLTFRVPFHLVYLLVFLFDNSIKFLYFQIQIQYFPVFWIVIFRFFFTFLAHFYFYWRRILLVKSAGQLFFFLALGFWALLGLYILNFFIKRIFIIKYHKSILIFTAFL